MKLKMHFLHIEIIFTPFSLGEERHLLFIEKTHGAAT